MATQPIATQTRLQAPAIAPDAPLVTDNPLESEAGGVLTIDLGAVFTNYRTLAARVLPTECAAVVKGDGYGLGLENVTSTVARAGCKTFFVAHLSEARRVRAIAPEAVIYVLNGFTPNSGPGFIAAYARPVISSSVELAEWDHFIAGSGWDGGAALHVDTGMNRLGLTVDEVAAVAQRMQSEKHGFTLLMSHFACADRADNPLNDRQIRQFREIRSLFRGVPSSLANSSGIFLDSAAYCDIVRPGVALYGVNPMPGRPNPMRPVVELKARVLQVRNVARGTAVGYGSAWTARRPSRIAVIAAGYADGIQRAAFATDAPAGREVLAGGKRCRMVGRISMDLMAVDVTDLPEGLVRRGDFATLIGPGLTIDEAAMQAGTIGYELLTNLGRRFHRVWKT
jgi:alanine racemase